MEQIATIGIDLAKNVFQVHGFRFMGYGDMILDCTPKVRHGN